MKEKKKVPYEFFALKVTLQLEIYLMFCDGGKFSYYGWFIYICGLIF